MNKEVNKILLSNLNNINKIKDILKINNKITISGLDDTIKPYFLYGLFYLLSSINKPLIIFTAKNERVEFIFNILSYWNNFFYYLLKLPSLKINKFAFKKEYDLRDDKISRLKIIQNLISQKDSLSICPINSILSPCFSLKEYNNKIIKIDTRQNISLDKLINKLDKIGYIFEKGTYSSGSFEKIGGLVNIFPINLENPVKIEFYNNIIEGIKTFDLKNKKTINNLNSINIHPINNINEEDSNSNNSFILDYLNTFKPILILDEPENFTEEIDYQNSEKLFKFEEIINKLNKVVISTFSKNSSEEINLSYQKIIPYQNDLGRFKKNILERQKEKYKIIIITNYQKQFLNLFPNLKSIFFIEKEKVNFENFNLASGFQDKRLKQILIFDKEILGDEIDINERKKVDRAFISELNLDDFVVHIDHGIGVFKGLTQKKVDEGEREFLIIEYGKGDKLFLPAEYTDKISKYIGLGKPKINRLHEASWKQIKQKVKRDSEKEAKELLQIYAQREISSGFIFSKDTREQKELEESFEYKETPDQIKTLEEIKSEMEGKSSYILSTDKIQIKKPMDRLVCGDVGFGKTEVAIRVAFKASQDKKQVALLCPTTILAQQHLETFSQRLKKFNCRIEVLSRFKTKKEQEEIIKKLTLGKIDIIIGTHRLLSPDIQFKDLGLIIIDEEQRFGVRSKEKLKKIRSKVDILTLTATPIPRTLNLALSKLKNISILQTPPQGRKAVKTFILPKNDQKIIDAIRFELKRSGQVYYLHNRVETIGAQLKRLKKIIPEAKYGIVHGKLSEKEMAEVMNKFNKKRELNVLICSSIIENGLDLPNVNTLIVDNAIQFGLADLHQLRGRIGRGDKEAYSYFFYSDQKLKDKAKKRLQALMLAKELGSGFQIAMQDLEIRGAGNILGQEQSGDIKVVGLNLYCQLLNQAIKEIKTGQKEDLVLDITLDLPVSAYIPKYFIKEPQQRIKLYQNLAKIHEISELENDIQKIKKKNQKIPKELENLFEILRLKILAKKAGIKSIDSKMIQKSYGEKLYQIVLNFNKIPPYQKIKKLLQKNISCTINENLLKIDLERSKKDKIIKILKEILVIL